MINPRTDKSRLSIQYADSSNLNARVRDFIQSSMALSDDFRTDLVSTIQARIDAVGYFFIRKEPGLFISKGVVV